MFEKELNEKLITFTHEVYFRLNGFVKKQNYRFWAPENPQISQAKSLHPVKVAP